MGADQCMEGEKSTSAPVCSFQRQVSGIATTPPTAAISSAVETPTIVANSPHNTLPRLMVPKNTVTNTANPRPRTHSGSATWADTFRLDNEAIHAAPAIRLASSAVEACPD